MKDLPHHKEHTRKKVLRSVRKENEEANEGESEGSAASGTEEKSASQAEGEEGIEIVEQPLVTRPLSHRPPRKRGGE